MTRWAGEGKDPAVILQGSSPGAEKLESDQAGRLGPGKHDKWSSELLLALGERNASWVKMEKVEPLRGSRIN